MQIMEIEYPYLDPCVELFLEVFNEEPWKQNWTTETAKSRLTESFLSSRFIGLMLAEEDFLRGFMMGYLETWENETHFCIKEFCIQTDKVSSEVTTELILASIKQLKTKDVTKVYALSPQNEELKEVFIKNGFSPEQSILKCNI